MTHLGESPPVVEWKIDYGTRRKKRKPIHEAMAAQVEDHNSLVWVEAEKVPNSQPWDMFG